MESIKFTELPHPLNNEIQISANSYSTREKVILVIDGHMGFWHTVKGGLVCKTKIDPHNLKGITYSVLYNPESNFWLKIVPPETIQQPNEGLALRLKKSIPVAKKALEVAGLPEIANQSTECRVEVHGKQVDGFISPHIGPSVEYYLRRFSLKQKQIPEDAKSFLSKVYKIAFNQALELYLKHNIWVYDPNPGNILMHFGQKDIRVTLIDFTNNKQISRPDFEHAPPERRSEQLLKKLHHLYDSFRKQSTSAGLNFIEYPEERFNEIVAQHFPISI